MIKNNAALVEEVKKNNTVRGVALQVYEILASSNGMTVGEVAYRYGNKGEDPTMLGRSRNELAKRVSDLVGMGAVKPVGTTVCDFTGRKATKYAITGRLPSREKLQEVKKVAAAAPQAEMSYPTLRSILDAQAMLRQLIGLWYVPSFFKRKLQAVLSRVESALPKG